MKKLLFLLLAFPLCLPAQNAASGKKPKAVVYPRPSAQKHEALFAKQKHLKPYYHHEINMAEPSDICLTTADPSHYYVVGNRGQLAETDSTGYVLRHTRTDGSDYEAVCVKDGLIYAIDESLRRLDVFDEKTFEVKKSILIPYGGARNKGFEGLVYVPSKKAFITVVEKPAAIVELNDQLQIIGQIKLNAFRELSSVTYHDNFLWLLSDEDHMVMKVNPEDFSVVDKWVIPTTNPEGICFDANGNLLIVSDDMATLFKFKIQ